MVLKWSPKLEGVIFIVFSVALMPVMLGVGGRRCRFAQPAPVLSDNEDVMDLLLQDYIIHNHLSHGA